MYTYSWDNQTSKNLYNQSSKKRKYSEDSDTESSEKGKKYELVDPMIFSSGTEIHFTADINKFSIELLIKEFTKIIDANDDPNSMEIKYIVDSPGGCVTSILKFTDYIRMVKRKYPNMKIISVATGLIASAGTIMCIIADERLMTKNAHAMIHELAAGNSGKYTHLQSHSKFLLHLHNALTDIYVAKTGKTFEEIEALLIKETWFDANEYLAGKFVDSLI
jgi:ATP-dependent protease ClpP protease subunit